MKSTMLAASFLCFALIDMANGVEGSNEGVVKAMKTYALAADQIKPLATGRGGCIATDMITVLGKPVGYMVRELPRSPEDSGWSFTSGRETQEYMDDASNHGIFDVNTIANYSPDIIPLLDAPPHSAFMRNPRSGVMVQIPYEEPLE